MPQEEHASPEKNNGSSRVKVETTSKWTLSTEELSCDTEYRVEGLLTQWDRSLESNCGRVVVEKENHG